MPAYALTNTIVNPGSQAPLSGDVIDLTISEQLFRLDGRTGMAMTINGTIPGPVIRLKEGQQVTLRVTNRLEESTSIHWQVVRIAKLLQLRWTAARRQLCRHRAGATFTYNSYPASAERHVLVPQPLGLAGAIGRRADR